MNRAGFVLVGGRSSRMGTDKARLRSGSRMLVEHIALTVVDAAGNITLIGDPAKYKDLPFSCLSDQRTGGSPLHGIETALASSCAEYNLIVGCDMPDLKPRDLKNLLMQSTLSDALAIAARDSGGRVHPLCAVYRRSALERVRRNLDSGRLRLMDLLHDLNAASLQLNSTIFNVNTPAAWLEWQRRAARNV